MRNAKLIFAGLMTQTTRDCVAKTSSAAWCP